MIPIRELFETHLTVSDLERAKKFYSDVLGLELAQEFPERDVAFFWLGGRGTSMLGLWQVGCDAAAAGAAHRAARGFAGFVEGAGRAARRRRHAARFRRESHRGAGGAGLDAGRLAVFPRPRQEPDRISGHAAGRAGAAARRNRLDRVVPARRGAMVNAARETFAVQGARETLFWLATQSCKEGWSRCAS